MIEDLLVMTYTDEVRPFFKDFNSLGELEIDFDPPQANVPASWAALWDDE